MLVSYLSTKGRIGQSTYALGAALAGILLGAVLAFGAMAGAAPDERFLTTLGRALDNPATTFVNALEALSPAGRVLLTILAAALFWALVVLNFRRVRDTGAPPILALPVIFSGLIGYLILSCVPSTASRTS
jgi:uncharacterized membrane protein YhaH (DUF805 family)